MKGIKRIYFVKTLTYLILAFLFLKYYFIDVLVEYSKGSSTYSVLTQEVDKLLIPQLILCFNPLYKPSKTEEFGIKAIDGTTEHDFNMTNWDLLQELSYQILRDFTIEFRNETRKEIPFKIQPIGTSRHGLCYLVNHDNEISVKTGSAILTLNLNSNLSFEDMPKDLKVWLSPKNAWHGILVDDWPYIDPIPA